MLALQGMWWVVRVAAACGCLRAVAGLLLPMQLKERLTELGGGDGGESLDATGRPQMGERGVHIVRFQTVS